MKVIKAALLGLFLSLAIVGCGKGFEFKESLKSTGLSSTSQGQPFLLKKDTIPQYVKTSFKVSGRCIANQMIFIEIQGSTEAPHLFCESGTFEFLVPVTGEDGPRTITGRQADLDGNTWKDSVTVTIDTISPVVNIVSMEARDQFVMIGGTCENDLPISFGGDVVSTSPPACKDGIFQVSAVLTAIDGEKNIAIEQVDKAGNKGAMSTKFVVDKTPPVVTVTAPANNTFVKDTVQISGSCERGLEVGVEGAGVLAPVVQTCSAQSNYSALVQLSAGEGSKGITVFQVDLAKNRGETKVIYVKDTTAPIITIVAPAENSISAGNVQISGSCENGLAVQFSGTGLAQAINGTCSAGTFLQSLTLSAANGSKLVSISQTDGAGNTTTVSRTFIKDTTAPALAVIAPANNAFVKNTVIASGTCQDGLAVTIAGTGVAQVGNINCTGGSFQTTLTLSAGDGQKTLSFSQTDLAGNKSEVLRQLTKDTVIPLVKITAPIADSTITAENVQISGTCESGISVKIAGAGAAATQEVTCSQGAFAANVVFTAANGTKVIDVSQTDQAGNTGADSRSFTKNMASTQLAITQPAANSLTTGSITLQGQCQSGVNVTISGNITAATSVACNNSVFSQNIILSAVDGTKTVTVSQALSNGTTAMDSRTFIKDSTTPGISILNPAANTPGKDGLTISGSCESGLTVNISGTGVSQSSTTTCNNSTFSAAILFSAGDGAKAVTVSQTDAVGNQGSNSRTFLRDNSAPVLTIDSPAANLAAQNGVTLVGKCEGTNAVQISGGGVSQASSTACSNNAYQAAVNFSSGDGTKSITISQADASGNIASVSRNFIRDTVAPALSISQPAANTVAKSGVTLSGTCENGLAISLSGAGLGSPSSTACSSGQFSVAITFSAAEGTKTISVSQTDGAGNSTSVSRNFMKDSMAPNITIASPVADSFVGSQVSVSGACETGITVVLYGSGVAANTSATCTAGMYSGQVTLTNGDGAKEIRAGQTDAAQNFGVAVVSVTNDTTAPVVTIATPAAGTSSATGVTISGACENNFAVVASGSGVASLVTVNCASGTYSAAVVFSAGDGTKTVTVTQVDGAGNSGTASRDFSKVTPVSSGATLYANYCAGCHGQLNVSSKIGRTADQITLAINNNIGGMGYLKTLTAAEVQAIADALKDPGAGGGTPGGGGAPPVDPALAGASEYRMTIGNAGYLAATYKDLFSNPASTTTENNNIRTRITNLITNQVPSIGGPCRRYDGDCVGGDQSDAPILPLSNAARKGYLIRACEEILSIDTAVTNALSKAGLTTASQATTANVTKLYDTFFPGRTPSAKIITDLQAVHAKALSSGQTATDAWRFILIPLCTSPNLEML